MSYKIYATDFLVKNGYGIVTGPIATGSEHVIETHAFFSGNPEGYMLEELRIESAHLGC